MCIRDRSEVCPRQSERGIVRWMRRSRYARAWALRSKKRRLVCPLLCLLSVELVSFMTFSCSLQQGGACWSCSPPLPHQTPASSTNPPPKFDAVMCSAEVRSREIVASAKISLCCQACQSASRWLYNVHCSLYIYPQWYANRPLAARPIATTQIHAMACCACVLQV